MGYNAIDLINKAIDIAAKRKSIYGKLAEKQGDIPSVKIISKVLIKELDKTIQYYKSLQNISNIEFEEIDLGTYDKISFLINEFNKRLCVPEIKNSRDYLIFSLDIEKGLYSLLIDIQGRFIKSSDDIHTKTYRILSDMINDETSHIRALEKTLK